MSQPASSHEDQEVHIPLQRISSRRSQRSTVSTIYMAVPLKPPMPLNASQ